MNRQDNDLNNKALCLREYLSRHPKYRQLGCGTTRTTFLCPSGKTVVKVPNSVYAFAVNVLEYQRYRDQFNPNVNPKNVKIAKCRLGVFRGVKVIYMEVVTPLSIPQDFWEHYDTTAAGFKRFQKDQAKAKVKIPEWVQRLDCFQAGLNSKKEVVAFDVGDNWFKWV